MLHCTSKKQKQKNEEGKKVAAFISVVRSSVTAKGMSFYSMHQIKVKILYPFNINNPLLI